MHKVDIQDSIVNIWYNTEKQAQILNAGATLNELFFDGVNVINGYELENPTNFSSCRSGWLYPFPNRIEDGEYTFSGKKFRWPVNETAKNNAIHGYAYTSLFQLVNHSVSAGKCELEFQLNKEPEPFFPFKNSLNIRYVFGKDSLVVFLTVKNLSELNMPFGLGWHPYFKMNDKLENLRLRIPVSEKVEVNERMIPTGRKSFFSDWEEQKVIKNSHFDTCYLFRDKNNEVVLRSGSRELKMIMGEEWEYAQLFTPSERDSIAIEPMTCNVDAFNNEEGLKILQPSNEFKAQISLQHRKL